MSKSITASQKIKGTDQVKYSAQITSTPENYDALLELAEGNETLRLEIFLAVNEVARNRTLARLGSLDRANQTLFSSIDFTEVMTTTLRKITAASMVTRLEAKLLVLGEDLQHAVEASDFELAAEIAADQKSLRVELAAWEEKRETERATKAASRAANKES